MTEPTDKPLLDEPPADEQQLDEYLKGDSSVSWHYRQLHGADVPPELDRLVLRRAEDAVKSRSPERPAWLRWSAPLAVAASAVLVLSIVIETGVRDETAIVTAAAPAMQGKRERAADEAEVNPASEEKVSEPAAPPPAEIDAPSALRLEAPSLEARRAAAPKVDAPQSVEQTSPAPPPVSAPTAAITAPEPALVDSGEDTAREEELPASTSQRMLRGQQNQAAGPRDTVATPGASAEQAYSRPISADMPPRIYSDPEAWLKDIRRLREENKQEEADREWRRFRAAFPKYEVAETDLARATKE